MKVTLYSNDCPKCRVLKKKLKESGIEFTENNNVDQMLQMGFTKVPVLAVDEEFFDFNQSMKWIAEQEQAVNE